MKEPKVQQGRGDVGLRSSPFPVLGTSGAGLTPPCSTQNARQGLNCHPGTRNGEGDIHESLCTPSELPGALAMFSPLHIAKKWLEAPSFCTWLLAGA